MPSRKALGRASRKKGQRAEREVARLFVEAGVYTKAECRRGWQSRLGTDEPDVVIPPPLWVECKHNEAGNVWAALAQADGDCQPGRVPVVFFKKNNFPRVAVMHAEDFVKLFGVLKAALGDGRDGSVDQTPVPAVGADSTPGSDAAGLAGLAREVGPLLARLREALRTAFPPPARKPRRPKKTKDEILREAMANDPRQIHMPGIACGDST